MVKYNRAFRKTDRHILDLAQDLVKRGCRVPTGLWIAMKYDGNRNLVPFVRDLSQVTGIRKKELVKMERDDLKLIDYVIVKF